MTQGTGETVGQLGTELQRAEGSELAGGMEKRRWRRRAVMGRRGGGEEAAGGDGERQLTMVRARGVKEPRRACQMWWQCRISAH